MNIPQKAESIIKFWFKSLTTDKFYFDSSLFKTWFFKNEEFDSQVRKFYEDDVAKAILGDYSDWKQNPYSTLSLVVLLD